MSARVMTGAAVLILLQWGPAALPPVTTARAAPHPDAEHRLVQAPEGPCRPQPEATSAARVERKAPAATIARMAWLAGVWTGVRGETSVEERWTPPAGGAMLATARTLRHGAMTAFEFLCIAERNGSLVYTALPNGRTPATDFVLTRIAVDAATFENPAHDFPKVIRYARRPDGSLETAVGNGIQEPQTFLLQPGT